jgi:hypothetical protein
MLVLTYIHEQGQFIKHLKFTQMYLHFKIEDFPEKIEKIYQNPPQGWLPISRSLVYQTQQTSLECARTLS